jgi:hypothetical protein
MRPRPPFSRRQRWSPVLVVLFIAVAVLALAVIIMFLWNTILVPLVGVARINWWQALGLFVLSRILFGRWGFGDKHSKHGPPRGRAAWKQKWRNMSEEERAEFKERWKDRCRKGSREG